MKKRVLTFFILLLVFAGLLVTVVLFENNKPTGYVISQDSQAQISTGPSRDFVLEVKSYHQEGENLYISYILADLIQKEQEIVVSNYIYDTEGNLVSEGKETVNLAKGATKEVTLQAPLINENKNSYNLKFSAWNGRVVNEQEMNLAPSSQTKITGAVIGANMTNLLPNILVTVIFGFFLFISFRFVNSHKKRIMQDELKPEFDKKTNRKFIKLNL